MLNKKQIFNIVYAIALVGAITACFGILNEFLQVSQLYGSGVSNFAKFWGKTFWTPCWFYLSAFIVGGASVVLVVWRLLFSSKLNPNVFLMIAMSLLFVMTMVQVFIFRDLYGEVFWLSYDEYFYIYTFRSAAMSLILHLGLILGCNIINEKYCKKAAAEQTGEKSET